jgi:hypothetical protein
MRVPGILAAQALALAIVACGLVPARAGAVYSAAPFQAGEVLTYKVKWGLFRLGTLRICQDPPDSSGGPRRGLTFSGKSAAGLPFIHASFLDHSQLDPGNPTTWVFTSDDGHTPPIHVEYRGDSSADVESYVESVGDSVEDTGRVPHAGPLYDLLGLFMLIRGMSGSEQEVVVSTLTEKQVRNTRLTFTSQVREERLDAFPEPVQVRHFEGLGDWTCKSCSGMSGRFQGWVTDNPAAIPVELSLKIGLGSVTLKLESCERPGQPGAAARSIDPWDRASRDP